jgi:hypothetical protein
MTTAPVELVNLPAVAHRRARKAASLMIGRESMLPIVTSDSGMAAKPDRQNGGYMKLGTARAAG